MMTYNAGKMSKTLVSLEEKKEKNWCVNNHTLTWNLNS